MIINVTHAIKNITIPVSDCNKKRKTDNQIIIIGKYIFSEDFNFESENNKKYDNENIEILIKRANLIWLKKIEISLISEL